MIGIIYVIYLVAVISMLAYFTFVYMVKPWDSGKFSKKFRYRIMKYTDIDTNGKELDRSYVIHRKYSILTPWLQLSRTLNTADEVSIMLNKYTTNDKEKSLKRKKVWLKDEEFLAEAL